MEKKLLDKKLQKLAKYYRDVTSKKSVDIESIHKIRIKTRELLSCISKENRFYSKLKKVIKLTNEIRDIDVFQNEFLKKLPTELKQHIDFDLITIHLSKVRALDYEKLQQYLYKLDIPQTLSPRDAVENKPYDLIQRVELKSFSQKELHRYRIYIKKELYFYKAFYPDKKGQIKVLTKIKDNLGVINDNNNAKKRIITFISSNEKELLSYIEKKNEKYLKKVLKLQFIPEF